MIDGRTAMELPGGARSADEVAAVWAYLKKRMAHVTANARTGRPAVPAGKKPAAARKARKSPVARQRKTTEQTVARKRKTAEETVTRKRKKPAAVKAVKPRARRTRKVSAPLRKAA
jgi:hypothetical protein